MVAVEVFAAGAACAPCVVTVAVFTVVVFGVLVPAGAAVCPTKGAAFWVGVAALAAAGAAGVEAACPIILIAAGVIFAALAVTAAGAGLAVLVCPVAPVIGAVFGVLVAVVGGVAGVVVG